MLWACLLLPSLPLEVFARSLSPADAARPFAVGTGGHYPRIVAVNDAARDAAIAPEQLVSAALARAPGIVLRDRDQRQETAALEAVAAWATQFTPAISLAPPDAVLAEIGGSLLLFGEAA
jgi:protein ImuB